MLNIFLVFRVRESYLSTYSVLRFTVILPQTPSPPPHPIIQCYYLIFTLVIFIRFKSGGSTELLLGIESGHFSTLYCLYCHRRPT